MINRVISLLNHRQFAQYSTRQHTKYCRWKMCVVLLSCAFLSLELIDRSKRTFKDGFHSIRSFVSLFELNDGAWCWKRQV